MKPLVILLSLLALLWPAAVGASGGPEEFLSAILSSDFQGDTRARLGKCHYTDGRFVAAECVRGDCAERREAFHPITDPLIVVSHWAIRKHVPEEPDKATFTARYTVIATTQGENEKRRIVPLAAPREEEATYKVWKRKGRWVWVDPPEVPYVGYEGVRTALTREIAEDERLLLKHGENELWRRALLSYRQQLAALEALRPLAAPPSSP